MKKLKKPPTIRPGDSKPFIKATNAQIEERIEFVAKLLVKQATRTEIHKLVRKQFGEQLHFNTIDTIYCVRARALLKKLANLSTSDAKTNGVNVLLHVIRTGSNRECIAAEQRLSEIFGYNAPRVTQLQGPDGGPVQLEDVTEEKPMPKEQLRAMLEIVEHGTRNFIGVGGNGAADRKVLTPAAGTNGESPPAPPGKNGSD